MQRTACRVGKVDGPACRTRQADRLAKFGLIALAAAKSAAERQEHVTSSVVIAHNTG